MELYPFAFRPVFRSYIWGGRRLGEVLGKPIGDDPRYAESWEIVDHGEDQSVVADGPLAGKTLSWLVQHFPQQLLGTEGTTTATATFPLLLKYLDCNRVLSVQVHPNDAYAATMNPPDLGKTEAWYVIDAQPGSVIYAGLNEGVDRETFATAIRTGRVEEVLHKIQATAGQCIFIPAGTVHALGAGILVAEIQQSSDTTFRVFDWDRVDDQGQPRPLHIDQALAVTDYGRGPIQPSQGEPLGAGAERLVACDKFVLDRYRSVQPVTLQQQRSFRMITVVEGGGTLHWAADQKKLTRGESMLIPAAVSSVEFVPFHSGTTLLTMMAPE